VATVDVTVASRAGRSRPVSEDRWVAVTGGAGLLLAVADGMGGTIGGGDAATAVLAGLVDGLAAEQDLATAVATAHHRVRELAPDGLPVPLRPGTTLTAGLVDGHRMRLAHLGDSSCWLLRRGRVRRLTEEHTQAAGLVRAGAVEPGSLAQRRLDGMLTRYAGMPGAACPQLLSVRLRPGDRLLVATDGVTRALSVPALATLLARPGTVAGDLVRAAVDAGGRDDATAVLAAVPMDTVRADLDTEYVGEGATR
jgi:PPM family protein phosphatase